MKEDKSRSNRIRLSGIVLAAPDNHRGFPQRRRGDPNASIPNPQPEYYRPMFGAFGRSLTQSSVTFVSQAGLPKSEMLGLSKNLFPVTNTRKIGKHSMVLNGATPYGDQPGNL